MSVVLVSDEGHVRTIRLNRPEVKNAVSQELAWGVLGAVEEATKDDNIWLICLTGSGDSFCSGLDLRGSEPFSPQTPMTAQLDDLGWVSQFLLTLREKCEKPIIGGLNGVAVGAGLSLALATDIRLMKRSARILAGYPRIGGSPDGGMTFTLSQALGYEQAMRFLLESKTVDAEEALRLGLVGEVVDDDQWDARLEGVLPEPLRDRLADHDAHDEAHAREGDYGHRPRSPDAPRTGEHRQGVRQPGCEGSPPGLPREAHADVRREVDPTGGASVFTQPWLAAQGGGVKHAARRRGARSLWWR